MKYFCTETECAQSGSSCFLEFQRGRYRHKHWLDSSVFLHDDIFERLGLYPVFAEAIPGFAHWGLTEVNREQYLRLKSRAAEAGGEILAAVTELDRWACQCFEKEDVFTICGI